jgi:hypothetical protein
MVEILTPGRRDLLYVFIPWRPFRASFRVTVLWVIADPFILRCILSTVTKDEPYPMAQPGLEIALLGANVITVGWIRAAILPRCGSRSQ